MKLNLLPYLDYLFGFRLFVVTDIGYAISAACYLIIYLKIKHSQDGAFRRYLMGYFGAAAAASAIMTLYHPFYNLWLLPVSHAPMLAALVALTWYILNDFWARRKENKHED